MRICDHCETQHIENETHFLFQCMLYTQIRNTFYSDNEKRYRNFKRTNVKDKVLFLFNNVESDPFVCKKWYI